MKKNQEKQKQTTFTVSIPDDLKKRMDDMPEINWPEYLKKRLEIRLQQVKKFDELMRRGDI